MKPIVVKPAVWGMMLTENRFSSQRLIVKLTPSTATDPFYLNATNDLVYCNGTMTVTFSGAASLNHSARVSAGSV